MKKAEMWYKRLEEDEEEEEMQEYQYSVDWKLNTEEIVQHAQELVDQMNETITEILDLEEARTFENTILPFAQYEAVAYFGQPRTFRQKVHPDPAIRAAAKEASGILGTFNAECWAKPALHRAIKNYFDKAVAEKTFETLDEESQRYVKRVLSEFKRHGVNLPDKERERVINLTHQIDKYAKEAQNNINEDTSWIPVELSKLQDLHQEALDQLVSIPDREGWVQLPLSSSQMTSALKVVEDRAFRKFLQTARDNQLVDKNVPLMEELTQKRHELALLLGYSSHSAMVLEELMAKNITVVQKFEDDLRRKVLPIAKRDIRLVNEKYSKKANNTVRNMEEKEWDFSYYRNLYHLDGKQEKIDEKTTKQYFMMEHVKNETMNIYQEFLGLKFRRIETANVWHEDVSYYEVKDEETEKILGHFYLDLHPRKRKYKHAAAFPLIPRGVIDGKVRTPTVAMVTNFPRSTKSKPSLMSHANVVTFFHEFGHIMHSICSEASYSRFAGTNVESDFAEIPSIVLEHWIWDKEILKRVSKNWETGEPMPDSTIQALIEGQHQLQSTYTLHNIFEGSFDLLLYSAFDKTLLNSPVKLSNQTNSRGFQDLNTLRKSIKKKDGFKVDIQALWHQLQKSIDQSHPLENTNPAATFGHVISGYDSQYYSYLWSRVHSLDLFQHIHKHGLVNREIGMKYRKIILAPGGSRDSSESLRLFLGREPNNKAYMARYFGGRIKD